MRRTIGLLVLLACTHAHAESPMVALRAGIHRTHVYFEGLDAYHSGDPNGNGLATELEAGFRFHPRWSASVFVDYARYGAKMGLEVQVPELRDYQANFDELYVGGRVTWHPSARFFLAGAIAQGEVWVDYRPLEPGQPAFDNRLGATILELTVGGEIARLDRFGVQLSIGFARSPFASDQDHVGIYIPLLVGFVWDSASS